jgi:hypothetical protein
MKITDISLYSSGVETISFGMRDLDPSARFVIRDITGLDAEDLIPVFYGVGIQSNAKFYQFAMKDREIVMRITLNPLFKLDENYSTIRDELYKAISSSRSGLVTILFSSNGTAVAKASAHITKFEGVYFTQLPEVKITLSCDDPMFRAVATTVLDPTQLKETNPVIVSDGLSTAPHGFSFKAKFVATSPTFTIQDDPSNPEWQFVVTPAGGFLVNDNLFFSSEKSQKYLYIDRAGVKTHLMDKVAPTSIWPLIFPGTNSFIIPEISKIDWVYLEFDAAYWGV